MATWMRSISLQLLLATVLLAGCASAPPSPPADQPVAQTGPRIEPQAQHCMAQAMYWEARGEGVRGMQAVGSVILNRVADRRFPNTPCGVVHQGGETPPCQFSWWCDGKSDRPTNQAEWAAALTVANEALTQRPEDRTGGALFFHNTSIRKPWQRQRTAQIGNHIFYR